MEMEEKVLKVLKDFGKLSTSKICNYVGRNHYDVKEVLDSLVKKKKIKKIEETLGVYWKLKEEK